MKKLTAIILLLVSAIGVRAQNCEAYFSINTNEYENPLRAHFNSLLAISGSGTTTSLLWNFGDGETSTEPNPSHTYTQSGLFEICLTLNEWNGGSLVCADTFCETVNISADPDCYTGFHEDYDPDLDLSFGFNDPKPDYYFMDYGDGSYWANATPPLQGLSSYHTYDLPGTYTVCLTALTLDNQNRIECITKYCEILEAQDTSSYRALFTHTVNGNQATFTSTSRLIPDLIPYWIFGDGDTSTLPNPVHQYANAGTYFVRLSLVDTTIWGSYDYIIDTVVIGTQPITCTPMFTFHYATNNKLTFQNYTPQTPQTQYLWDFGDGTSSTLKNPTKQYSAVGSYDVCLESREIDGSGNTLCLNSYCLNVDIADYQTVPCQANFHAFSFGDYMFYDAYFDNRSQGSTYSSFWDFGNGDYDTLPTPIAIYNSPGTYNVCLTINDQSGCTDTYCEPVTISECSDHFQIYHSQAYSNEVSFTLTGFGISSSPSAVAVIDYGDGAVDTVMGLSSNLYNTYNTIGNYSVCVTITDTAGSGCNAIFCDSVEVKYIRKRYLYGQVVTNMQTTSNLGMVYAIKLVGNDLIAVDSTYFDYGHYSFNTLDTGQYLLKAVLEPTASDYLNYLPTYYGDTLFWADATPFGLYQDTVAMDINMKPGINPGGPGFVGGNVYQGANKVSAVGDPIPQVQIMLLNMDNSGVQYTYSDANGDYSFSNVAYGSYKLYAEVLGKTTYYKTVTIDAANTELSHVDIVITDEAVFARVSGAASITENIKLYPNPATEAFNIQFSAKKQDVLTVNIVSVYGVVIAEYQMEILVGVNFQQLNIQWLSSGIYFVQITNEVGDQAVYRVVKE